MVTADLAIAAMAAVSLAVIIVSHRRDMKVADRLRIVNPPKEQPQGREAAQQPVPVIGRPAA